MFACFLTATLAGVAAYNKIKAVYSIDRDRTREQITNFNSEVTIHSQRLFRQPV